MATADAAVDHVPAPLQQGPASVIDDELPLGSRIQTGRDRATVVYTGPVVGQTGAWVGVEWDDASRGKHDGSTGGIRYFTAAGGPTAGSFIRREKVPVGVSVVAALHARYNNEAAEFGGETTQEEMYVFTLRQMKVPIRMIGADQVQQFQRQTQHLTTARLVGAGISHVGDVALLAEAGPNLGELDLTCNLVGGWDFVAQLAQGLPKLQVLDLSDNVLFLPSVPSAPSSLPGLRSLVLNNCGVTWQQVLLLEPCLPNLEKLHLRANRITSLAPPAAHSAPSEAEGIAGGLLTGFVQLQVVDLEDNQLADWAEVERLAHLPALAKLHLSNNPIPHVAYPAPAPSSADAAAAPPPPFASLKALFLGGCQLSTWRSVDQLDHFPQLSELRLSGNSVLAASKSGGRFEVIARVSRLCMYNGADVKPRERQDSEFRYLQHVASELGARGDHDEAMRTASAQAAHPRLLTLLKMHGEVAGTTSKVGSAGSSLAASLYELKLTCVALSKGAKMGSQTKKLPRSTTLGALRQLCEKLFRVPVARQALSLRNSWDPVAQELPTDDDNRQLTALGVQDGYEVLVDEFDPDKRVREEQQAREAHVAEHAARAAGQLKQGDMLIGEFARSIGLPGAAPAGV